MMLLGRLRTLGNLYNLDVYLMQGLFKKSQFNRLLLQLSYITDFLDNYSFDS